MKSFFKKRSNLFAVLLRLLKPLSLPKKSAMGGRRKEIYSKLISTVICERFSEPGISEYAMVVDSATIAESATVSPGVYIGANVRVGENTRIYPNTTILDDTVIGHNVLIGSGAVIGAEGFGFYYERKSDSIKHVPQIQKVILHDSVFIGGNTTICRGSKRDTKIGEGTKINSNVHIAHNCVIGRNCLIMASVSIHGSTFIGDQVIINPMAAISKNITIGDNAEVGMNSTVLRDVRPNTRVLGSPAKEK